MVELKIINIYTDGYERFAEVSDGGDKKLVVHFLEYQEYLDASEEESKIKKVGDVLKGDIHIDLVSNSYIKNDKLMFYQPISKSSHIIAVIEVEEKVDEYSFLAKTSLNSERILIEFEDIVNYSIGDRIYIEGSLEIDELSTV